MKQMDSVNLKQLVIHKVGNKTNSQDFFLSKQPVTIEDPVVNELLIRFFFHSFKSEELYHFHHESDLNLNEVYHYVTNIFNDPGLLFNQSVHLAKHLLENSDHPQIKTGEFYVTYFSECILEDELCDAIGIFKSENKETYLKVFQHREDFSVDKDHGINIQKLDKGCLIFNTEQEHGYKLKVIDNTNKSEARYWLDSFLNVKIREDDYYHTQNYMQMCRDFAMEAIPEAEKVDQLELMNNSASFFKENASFDKTEFHEKVLQRPEIIEAFEDYKTNYQEQKQVKISDEEFNIKPQAVKKLKNVFKSVIKLDKNFHIYVHGNRDMIKKGYDEDSGMKFYQLFYNEEE